MSEPRLDCQCDFCGVKTIQENVTWVTISQYYLTSPIHTTLCVCLYCHRRISEGDRPLRPDWEWGKKP